MKKKIIALVLCVCLISSSCIQPAYAVGAEGIIIGGGAAAGVTLTLPQVALIVAAGYGLVYAAQHAEEIADGLNTALTNAANNVADGLEVLSGWKDNALKGLISLSSAPAWIAEAVKSWVSGLYESKDSSNMPNTGVVSFIPNLPAGEKIPSANPINPQTFSATKDVTIVRLGRIVKDSDFYNLSFYLFALSPVRFDGGQDDNLTAAVSYTVGGKSYYAKRISTGASVRCDSLEGYNLQLYEAANSLLPLDDLESAYANVSGVSDKVVHAWVDGYFDGLVGGSVCPDTAVGGIGNAVEEHGIDNINVPDMNIGASGLLAPEVVGDGSIDDVLNDVLTRLKEQELAWSDYVADVGVGNPSVSIPQEDGSTLDFPITDVGVGDTPIESPTVSEGLEPYTIDLTDFFPFCIPFDIVDFVSVLCAEPEAPCFEWEFTWYDGSKDSLTIDLSPFDQVAQLLRNMELLLFCIGLALITRNQIRG